MCPRARTPSSASNPVFLTVILHCLLSRVGRFRKKERERAPKEKMGCTIEFEFHIISNNF